MIERTEELLIIHSILTIKLDELARDEGHPRIGDIVLARCKTSKTRLALRFKMADGKIIHVREPREITEVTIDRGARGVKRIHGRGLVTGHHKPPVLKNRSEAGGWGLLPNGKFQYRNEYWVFDRHTWDTLIGPAMIPHFEELHRSLHG